MVPMIATSEGRTSSHIPEIVDRFRDYYEELYSSRQEEMGTEMDTFLGNLLIPCLSDEDRMALDTPISLEEMQRTVQEMAGQKSPGPDGLSG